MAQRWIYFNGKYVSEQDARISIFDSALMFGDMVFEMTRSFNGKQFKLREHLERLYSSIQYCRIPIDMTIDEMEEKCYEVIEKNKPAFEEHDEHRLMINVSRGPLSIYHRIFKPEDVRPTIVIADFPLKWTVAGMGKLYDKGINAVIPSQRAIPADLLDPRIKNRSRLHYQMANIEVSNWKGEDNWALLLDPDGFIAEGTGDNFFIVKDNLVITPEGRNILRGISRDYIFELCEKHGIKCVEKNITPYDVYNADEAFMTGTPFSLIPVTGLNSEQIGDGKMGQMTKHLIDKWGESVGVDLVKQIKDYNSETTEITQGSSPYAFRK